MFKGYRAYYASLSSTYQRGMIDQVGGGTMMAFVCIAFFIGAFSGRTFSDFVGSILIAFSVCLFGNLIASHVVDPDKK